MPRWVWFAPLGLLILLSGVWAFRQGWIAATISETDVIEAWSAHYVTREVGARRSDCSARPGSSGDVWILVTCVHSDGRRFDFPTDRLGRLVPPRTDAEMPEAPQT